MKTGSEGLKLIKEAEGFSAKAYQDVIGVWTIGYGSATTAGFPIKPQDTITEEKATEWLQQELSKVEVAIKSAVHVPLTQNQFDALASLIYNIGVGNFQKSTLLKLINQQRYQDAAQQFLVWNKAGGKEVKGLSNRRKKELDLFIR